MCVSVLAPACVCGSIHQTFKSVPGFSLDVVKDTLNTSVWTAIGGIRRQKATEAAKTRGLKQHLEERQHLKKWQQGREVTALAGGVEHPGGNRLLPRANAQHQRCPHDG